MKTINELKELAQKQINQEKAKNVLLFDPIFRIENNKLYLGYVIMIPQNDTGTFKRPIEWFLQDLSTGEIIEINNSNTKDFTTKEKLPFDLFIDECGLSHIYDGVNILMTSFFHWKKDIIYKLEEYSKIQDEVILKFNENQFSPSDYTMANIDEILNKMENVIYEFSEHVDDGLHEYYNYLANEIIKSYLDEQNINKDLIDQYLRLLKYLWPASVLLIECFDNIER